MATTTIFPSSELDKPNRPSASAFKQQKLPAWQPILTAGTVLPTFFCIAFLFIPIGIGLLVMSNKVTEKILDYTNCGPINRQNEAETCASILAKTPTAECKCVIEFALDEEINKEVFVYYGLTNFYQNHRRYVKSREDKQLRGQAVVLSETSDCAPFHKRFDTQNIPRPIAPCGAIANSMFNDTFLLRWKPSDGAAYERVPLRHDGIAWATDLQGKFKNPPYKGDLSSAFENTSKPFNWKYPVYELYKLDPSCRSDNPRPECLKNNGYENQAFIVWMRTAALPSFRKLYARVDSTKEFQYKGSLPKGKYELTIEYNFPVTTFKGTKRFIISNTSFLGGKNPFLGIGYLVVGSVFLVIGIVFLIIHKKYGKTNSELLSINQRTPFQAQ